MPDNFYVALVIGNILLIFAGCGLAAFVLARRPLEPFVRRLLIALLVIELVLAGLHILAWRPIPPFWRWALNLESELTPGAIFAAVQLMLAGLVAFTNGIGARSIKRWQRLYWWFLAAFFGFLGIDEFYMIHDGIIGASWSRLYAVVGVGVVLLSALAYWFGFRESRGMFALLLDGLAVIALSGIGVEHLVYHYICPIQALGPSCHRYLVFEEGFELVGATIVLAGFLSYSQSALSAQHWRRAKRVWLGFAVFAALWFFAAVWIVPGVEATLAAQSVGATAVDGALTLVGYRAPRGVAAPGDDVELTLYLKANEWLDADYYLSVHVLTQPGLESVAQFDMPLGAWNHPSRAWLPGCTVRHTGHLALPDDLPTPASYKIVVVVWDSDKGASAAELWRLKEGDTDHQLVTDNWLGLYNLPLLSDAGTPEPLPPTPIDYRFAGGVRLVGIELPETATLGEALSLTMWWQTDEDIEVNDALVQFIHLSRSSEEGFLGHDTQPFGARFPMTDWPGGVSLVDDTISIPLPPDMPPGLYRVYTGLYVPITVDRVAVAGADGQPVADYAIELGTIELRP